MKRISSRHTFVRGIAALSLTAAVALLSACGGGGGGGGFVPTGLSTGTFTKITPTAAPDGSVGGWSTTSYIHYQFLYTAGAINASGKITGISVQYRADVASQISCPNVTIKLGHTNLANLTTTFANNVQTGQGSQVTVLNNSTVTFPAGTTGTYQTISFATPFEYNGRDNLVVDVERTSACSAYLSDNGVANAGYTALNFTSVVANPTGTTSTGIQNYKMVFGGGDNRVSYPGNAGNAIPFWNLGGGSHVQMLHLASDINGSGPITGIAMISTEAPTNAASYTINVKLGHTSLAALTTSFAGNFNAGSPTTVATGLTFNVPAGVPAGTPIWLPLTGTFSYNGTDNLIVDIEVTSPVTENTFWSYDSGLASRRMYANVGSATGTVNSGAYHTEFRFHGAPVSVITDGGADTGFAFSTGTNGRLNLYRASELGSAGTINSIACRMQNANSVASSYANYRVIIGHSNVDTLDATAANNFVSQTTAVNATISVPAGLVAGDWIEVPLSTPFAYNGTSNLAIWMGTTAASGAAASHNCLVSTTDAVRYPGHMGSGAPGAAGITPQNFKFDMKLGISR